VQRSGNSIDLEPNNISVLGAIRPHGYIVKEHPDDRIRTFLEEYRTIAGYLGLGHALLDLIVTPPPPTHPAEVESASVQNSLQLVIQPPSPMAQEPSEFSSQRI
jgi:hypothetical protein